MDAALDDARAGTDRAQSPRFGSILFRRRCRLAPASPIGWQRGTPFTARASGGAGVSGGAMFQPIAGADRQGEWRARALGTASSGGHLYRIVSRSRGGRAFDGHFEDAREVRPGQCFRGGGRAAPSASARSPSPASGAHRQPDRRRGVSPAPARRASEPDSLGSRQSRRRETAMRWNEADPALRRRARAAAPRRPAWPPITSSRRSLLVAGLRRRAGPQTLRRRRRTTQSGGGFARSKDRL